MRRVAFIGVLTALSVLLACGGGPAPQAAPTTAPSKLAPTAAAPTAAQPTAAAAGASAGPTLGPGPKVSIQLVAQPLPSLLQYTKVEVPYAKEIIPKRTNGRVELTLGTWSERNLTGNEIIRLTRQGVVEVGGSGLSYLSGDVPLLDAADLAGLNPTLGQARKVLDALTPAFNKELERYDVKLIGSFPQPGQIFFCRQPIKSLDDLKGKKVRTFGVALNDLMLAIGAQPVSITFAEVYESLQRGLVDCAVTGTGSGNSVKWYEVTTHMYLLPVGWATNAYFVNLNWWNKLDPDVQRFLDATFKELTDRQWELIAELTQDGVDCNAGRPSCKLGTLNSARPMIEVKPTEEDLARLRKAIEENVVPSWVKRCGASCGDTYNQVVAPITGVKYVAR